MGKAIVEDPETGELVVVEESRPGAIREGSDTVIKKRTGEVLAVPATTKVIKQRPGIEVQLDPITGEPITKTVTEPTGPLKPEERPKPFLIQMEEQKRQEIQISQQPEQPRKQISPKPLGQTPETLRQVREDPEFKETREAAFIAGSSIGEVLKLPFSFGVGRVSGIGFELAKRKGAKEVGKRTSPQIFNKITGTGRKIETFGTGAAIGTAGASVTITGITEGPGAAGRDILQIGVGGAGFVSGASSIKPFEFKPKTITEAIEVTKLKRTPKEEIDIKTLGRTFKTQTTRTGEQFETTGIEVGSRKPGKSELASTEVPGETRFIKTGRKETQILFSGLRPIKEPFGKTITPSRTAQKIRFKTTEFIKEERAEARLFEPFPGGFPRTIPESIPKIKPLKTQIKSRTGKLTIFEPTTKPKTSLILGVIPKDLTRPTTRPTPKIGVPTKPSLINIPEIIPRTRPRTRPTTRPTPKIGVPTKPSLINIPEIIPRTRPRPKPPKTPQLPPIFKPPTTPIKPPGKKPPKKPPIISLPSLGRTKTKEPKINILGPRQKSRAEEAFRFEFVSPFEKARKKGKRGKAALNIKDLI